MLVQLRFATELTGDEYVTRQAWREATLAQCPLHPRGGCGFARHGSYPRQRPAGTRIARWYCRAGHCTFSLLPDPLAARFPGTLADLEQVVVTAEQARSQEAAANQLRRDDITLPSAVRWTRRRVRQVHALLTALVGLLPVVLVGCAPTVWAIRERLGGDAVLVRLRAIADPYLSALPRPLGFQAPSGDGGQRTLRNQHYPGPDPPAADR